MDYIDFFTIPIYTALILSLGYYIRPLVTNQQTKKFFIPALSIKIFGAISLGLIYTLYYRGGDTINYYNDAQTLFNGILSSPLAGIKVFLRITDFSDYNFYKIRSALWYYKDPSSYVVVQTITILSFLCFKSYGAIAILFAAISFSGLWMLFYTFCFIRNELYKKFAIGVLFVPSVVFWGSGIMKDSICIAALGWLFYGCYRIIYGASNKALSILIVALSGFILLKIKIYILICFLPVALYWFFLEKTTIKNKNLQFFLRPFILVAGGSLSILSVMKVSEASEKYNLESITNTVQVTSHYLSYVSRQQNGSGYTLSHTFDGSITSLLTLSPEAINVTYLRPYLWEAKNAIMMLSAFESLAIFILVCYTAQSYVRHFFYGRSKIPAVAIISLIFVLLFGVAIGISTYNFGTLVRYKIPAVPFLLCSLFIIIDLDKKKIDQV